MLNCLFYILLFLYLIDSLRICWNKCIFCNMLIGWSICGDKLKFVDLIKNSVSEEVVS